MIELLEGVPGAGKSYHAVAEYLLPWVRKGRRIYVYVDGFYLDRLAKFEGRPLEELQQQITVWSSGAEVLDQLTKVDPGSAVFIDECQTVFRAQQKLHGEILRWLETHRHYGIDVLLICQDYRQVTSGVTRVVEMTTKFRRLDRFGFKNRYQAFVRGNPEELEIIRGFTGTYEPTVYAYYGSYATSTKEVRHVRSILRSPSIILGALGLCVALSWFLFGGGTFGGGTTLPPPPVRVPVAAITRTPQEPEPSGSRPVVHPIRIQGGMSDPRQGGADWLWVTDDGRLLTVDEIAAESGGTVQAVTSRGVKVLKGSGVLWGGTVSPQSGSAGSMPEPVLAPSRLPTRTDPLVAPTSARVDQSGVASPADLITSDRSPAILDQGTEPPR
ncbi:protein of unknown function [Nitrospira japonica]|uniref:Zona occludens toxin N-terminal domain-containing protein n=1 Tax=Nitrospira japonica TaxID=1325564 RepID=A0A1W1I579_9BACT|nr:zonular occludens toxin domain-containing protein [Nitrospira japonica]SLM48039.1 protein of unknown function [Nitrospira japonica]